MSLDERRRLVELLRKREPRTRTGILLLSPAEISRERDLAARLGIDSVDYAEILLDGVVPGSRYVGISAEAEEARLDRLAMSAAGADCAFVYNFDLALARLETSERIILWRNLFDRFPYRLKSLILAVPARAEHLLPMDADRQAWIDATRIAPADDPPAERG